MARGWPRTILPRPLLARVHTLEQRQTALLADLLREHEFVIGSVTEVRIRCGNPRCRCATGPGHPEIRLLVYTAAGRRQCKLVPPADWDRIRRAGARYRHLRALAALQARQLRLLRALVRQSGLRYP